MSRGVDNIRKPGKTPAVNLIFLAENLLQSSNSGITDSSKPAFELIIPIC